MDNEGFRMSETDKRYGATDGSQTSPVSENSPPSTNNNRRTNNRDDRDRHLSIDVDDNNAGNSKQQELAKKVDDDDDDLEFDGNVNIFARIVVKVRKGLYQTAVDNKKKVNLFLIFAAIVLYNAYLITAVVYHVNYQKGESIDWCNGVGILIVITAIVYWCFFYYYILRGLFAKQIKRTLIVPLKKIFGPLTGRWYFSYGFAFLALAAAVAFIIYDTRDNSKRLISAGGILVILFLGLLVSKHPGHIKWSQVFWGLGLQFVFGLIILRWDGGRQAFDCISDKVKTFLAFSDAGSSFVYGYLVTGNVTGTEDSIVAPSIFVFKSLSVIFFFSFFISLLYHYGAMMWFITKLGWFLQVTVGTTAAESMNAAANIFIGQTEAPILIKPFLADMTKSELHAVMTGGFSTIAGSVMGAYISFGIEPSYLLSASIMAAPAALAVSKLLYPETKKSRTTAAQLKSISLKTGGNALDAASSGAAQGVMLIGNIVANVIAFMAFIAFLNTMVSWFGSLVGLEDFTFETILGKVFIPLAYVIGVDAEEVEDVALLLGLKTVVNEFVAYQRLIEMKKRFKPLSERAVAISTYALCSFANFSSIGIQLGGIGFMAPERRADLAQTIWFAFLAGNACGLLNACIAGTLLNAPGYSEDNFMNSTTASSLL